MEGIEVTLYWQDGAFFVSVAGQEVRLSPWVGVQLEEWRDNGRDWRRDDMAHYEPVDLLNYLERTGQHLRRSRRTKH